MKKSAKKLLEGLLLVVAGGVSGYLARPVLEQRFPALKGKTTTPSTPALPSGSQAVTGVVNTDQNYAGGSNTFDESANGGSSLPDFSV